MRGVSVLMLMILLSMLFFGGGNEDVGWGMILQPELEKFPKEFSSVY